MSSSIPHLKATSTSQQLIVNGQPYLMLAAELQNSAMTSAKYMREAWPKLVKTNINTVLGCVTWEQIEPEEGKFDFSELDDVIKDARSHGLHLILLWFGSFKNGISTYTPAWVKKDSKRFPRARLRKAGGDLEISQALSIFHSESAKADAKAFGKLIAHVKEVDEQYSTVVMVQVENETGLLGDSRDGSVAANKRFDGPVPSDLIERLRAEYENLRPELRNNLATFSQNNKGTWAEVFGHGKKTDELFMAYHYALYLEQVAASGKKAYPLPLYTNVWQNYMDEDTDNGWPVIAGGGGAPGDYPSGGGVIETLDIWQLFAPSLDFIAPDVYLNEYSSSCAKYRHRNQPLFIPEQRRDEFGARRVFKAMGSHQALCTSPFGIDTLEPETNPYTRTYGLLAQVSSHILKAQSKDTSVGFYFDELSREPGAKDPSPPVKVKFGPWNLLIERSFVFGHPSPGCGIVIHKGGDRFMLIGWGFQVTFTHEMAPWTGILSFDEKEVQKNGELKTLRMLNGDETRSGRFCIMPSEDPDYGGFPICVTIPSRTCIAEAVPYALWHDDECC